MARQTPYNEKYVTCARTTATLRIYSDELDPREIEKYLQIPATQINRKGEARTSPRGRTRILPKNAWFLSSEGQVASKDLRHHLDWLLAKLEGAEVRLGELQAMPEVRMSVNCVWWSAYGHGGPTLWPEQMRRLAELDLECTFDIYFVPEEGD
jgi:hypothetical protein